MRIRHVARFCRVPGIESAHFVGNSMGAINLLNDATADAPLLPIRGLVIICGGKEIQQNEHFAALPEYDASLPGMRRIVEALFHGPGYPADDEYVGHRYESSTAPARGRRWPRFGSGAPAPNGRRRRRMRGHTGASRCRR